MSKKPNKQKSAPAMSGAEARARSRAFIASVALVAVSVCKVLTAIFFDLGAVSNFTGAVNPDLAVASGMGRVCFAGGLVLFMAGAYGLGLKRAQGQQIRTALLLGIVAAACGLACFFVGIGDGHNPSDIAFSLIGAAVAAIQARYVRQLR